MSLRCAQRRLGDKPPAGYGAGFSCFADQAHPVAYNVVPQYSKSQVDAAGRTLVDGAASYEARQQAIAIINNWRSAHSFPLNTFTVGLRRRAAALDENALVAQRIKRLSSIRSKLVLLKGLRLSQVQDFGGCRAVLASAGDVATIASQYRKGDLKHKLVRSDDYMTSPKQSGYRGIHLIYRYYSDKKATYNDLQIEIQLRSQIQHAWATAVETVGTFTRQALKSSQGAKDWLRFFALMGTGMAYIEGTASVPGTPTQLGMLVDELREVAHQLDVRNRLITYGEALSTLEKGSGDAHYFLLVLDPAAQQVTVTGFARSELAQAQAQYLAAETSVLENEERLAVLVSVDSVNVLKRAYPNYFLDTQLFLSIFDQIVAPRPASSTA